MPAIRLLVVADGYFLALTPPKYGISFAPSIDLTNNTFTISEFLYLIQNHPALDIVVTTAHRRADPNAKLQHFNFAQADLSQYDVIWMFGHEGWNGGYYGKPIGDDEVIAIARFMNAGGGIFAAGDHTGMGSYMCGQLPRIRGMRKWFGQASDLPSGYPSTAYNHAGAQVSTVNWPANSTDTADRADTLRKNPSDTDTQFQFDDQSDGIPMEIGFPGGVVHPLLQGPNGALRRWPDHMHEGEVVTPIDLDATITLSNGESFAEFPAAKGERPVPTIIATADIVGGHTTVVEGSTCETNNFSTDPKPTVAGKIGVLCAYDGIPAGVGRVLTDSSFHHYLDLNLVGDPCGVSVDRQQGFGKALSPPEQQSVLADMQSFYGNAVAWLARA